MTSDSMVALFQRHDLSALGYIAIGPANTWTESLDLPDRVVAQRGGGVARLRQPLRVQRGERQYLP